MDYITRTGQKAVMCAQDATPDGSGPIQSFPCDPPQRIGPGPAQKWKTTPATASKSFWCWLKKVLNT